jgi:hypothetical protein
MRLEHLKEYLLTYSGDERKVQDFIDFMYDAMDRTPVDMVNKFYDELDDFLDNITHEKIEHLLTHIIRKDGVVGIKWSCEETKSVAKQYDVINKLKNHGVTYNDDCWWFALNYAYAVHYCVSKSVSNYVDIAIDELTNKNIKMKYLIRHMLEQL